MTIVTYIGNATSDAELRYTQSGTPVANFNLAINTRSKQGDQYVDDPTLFVRVNVWQDMAVNVAESIRKGDRVIVQGRQKQTEFTDRDGNTRQSLEVTADAVGLDLRWATASASKNPPKGQGGRQAPQQGGYGQPQAAPQGDPWTPGGQGNNYDQSVPF